ncbi:gamma-glutamyl-gamma-aminobutyrate hydrolase family protein [Deinococcus sp. KSM4-11]|uniref:gamma-glutamyl-gamma-aminobutyrate hydrolase family protein n=1 Tax=Deinococcus sp. KSM4-11 TaxID=2568654 RepID=UPI0010A35BDE|nr:gamma-glutamyl-gamma-aminobutyrate hydrolase family protein [Deinococcus sp. KSM4-11]THF84333.1 gamma-glutamyl-gamma-aminobutyrate hydrolase family protein [Deinococcus sp. KSM4-11]
MPARPLIGLSTSQPTETSGLGRRFSGTSQNYAEGLAVVGALPIQLPPLPELAGEHARIVDAVLLTGGVDVHPRHFGAHPVRGLGEVDEGRDRYETELYRAARTLGKPVFGICRGVQMINVLEGGTLWQHLPDHARFWVDHAQVARPPTLGHEVTLVPGSALHAAHGERALVNSYHHQGIDVLAPTLRAAAHAPDGLVEAVEGDGLVAVQWHPELLFAAHPHTLSTFHAFMAVLHDRHAVRPTPSHG